MPWSVVANSAPSYSPLGRSTTDSESATEPRAPYWSAASLAPSSSCPPTRHRHRGLHTYDGVKLKHHHASTLHVLQTLIDIKTRKENGEYLSSPCAGGGHQFRLLRGHGSDPEMAPSPADAWWQPFPRRDSDAMAPLLCCFASYYWLEFPSQLAPLASILYTLKDS
jgi:hypothetical protein